MKRLRSIWLLSASLLALSFPAYGETFFAYLSSAQEVPSSSSTATGYARLAIKRPVEFDGDGRQDLSILRFPNIPPPNVAPISYWNRNSFTGTTSVIQFGDATRDFPVPGDYDGDGKDDLALYRGGQTGSPN